MVNMTKNSAIGGLFGPIKNSATASPLLPRMFGGTENPWEVKSAGTETWVPEVLEDQLNP